MEQKIILLADDDSDDREMFHEALELIDTSLLCYSTVNGSELLKRLYSLEEMPQLIFLDMNMPVMNGWQCLKALKDNERYKHIPVIIISTSSHQKEMDTSIHLGALCYFIKPNDFKDLTDVLKVIINNLGPGLSQVLIDLQTSGCKHISL